MKNFTIIAGVSGVGKTSMMGVLRAEHTDLGKILCEEDASEEVARDIISNGHDFSLETALYGGMAKHICLQAKEAGYNIRMYYIGLDTLNESLFRIRNRVERGGCDVSAKDVESQFAHRFEDVLEILPYCDEAKLFDNYNGFALVAEYRNGEILPVGTYRPAWLSQLLEKFQKQ